MVSSRVSLPRIAPRNMVAKRRTPKADTADTSAAADPDADEALCSLAPRAAVAASRLVYAAVAIDYFAVGMMRTLLPYFGQQLGG